MSRIFSYRFMRATAAALALVALSACGLLGSKSDDQSGEYSPLINPNTGRKVIFAGKDGPEVLRYVYRPALGYVRIERIEAGAAENSHPLEISRNALRQRLESVNLKGRPEPIFTKEELNELVPNLVVALAKVAPGEDVAFAVGGSHGLFGSYSSRTVTTGRVFVRDHKLNVVFGVIHDPYEVELQSSDVLQPFPMGTRAKRIDTEWPLAPGEGRLAADDRPDWIVFDIAATEPATSTPAAATRAEDVERRLRLLDRLKENGTITEEEYREKRRAILREL